MAETTKLDPDMKPLPLSVAVITLNEEQHLQRCLESVEGMASEIVVIDSGSTDRTPEIARRAGAIFEAAPWAGFLAQKNRALHRCSQPWVLALDADEVLTPELAESVRGAVTSPQPGIDGFEVNRRTFYLGDWIWHAWYPEWILRLVRRDAARWTGLDPHPHLDVGGATKRLAGDLLHYSFRHLQDHLQRTIRYSQTMANSYAEQGWRFRWRFLLLSPGAAVIKHLILKQGWRDGWRGWLISIIRGVDVFAKYAFLLEYERAGSVPKQASTKRSCPANTSKTS